MGLRQCSSDHSFVAHDLGAGMQRLECVECQVVVLDLVDDDVVSAPGLFKPSPPTIFSVLGEEQRADETPAEGPEHSGRFAFGGSAASL